MFKYVRVLLTGLLLWRHFHALNMTRHKTKRDWLLYLSVIWPLGRALAIQSGQSFQTFSRQSEGLAMWDYHNPKPTHRIAYTKSIFAYQYHEFLVLFGVLFIRTFMRLGC